MSTLIRKKAKVLKSKSTPRDRCKQFGFWRNINILLTYYLIFPLHWNSRDDKRYIEKKNKAERAKLKKEDGARLRKLVDTAFSLDPRMAAFKEQDKEAKEAKKKERLEQAKQAKRDAEREAALAKELEEEKESSERLKKEEEKREKEAKKKAIRKEKKSIKTLMKVPFSVLCFWRELNISILSRHELILYMWALGRKLRIYQGKTHFAFDVRDIPLGARNDVGQVSP